MQLKRRVPMVSMMVYQLEGDPRQEILAVLLCPDGCSAPLRHPADYPPDAATQRRGERAAAKLRVDSVSAAFL